MKHHHLVYTVPNHHETPAPWPVANGWKPTRGMKKVITGSVWIFFWAEKSPAVFRIFNIFVLNADNPN